VLTIDRLNRHLQPVYSRQFAPVIVGPLLALLNKTAKLGHLHKSNRTLQVCHAVVKPQQIKFGQQIGTRAIVALLFGYGSAVVAQHVGDFGKLVYACHDWQDKALGQRSMELFATEVMPRVNSAIA